MDLTTAIVILAVAAVGAYVVVGRGAPAAPRSNVTPTPTYTNGRGIGGESSGSSFWDSAGRTLGGLFDGAGGVGGGSSSGGSQFAAGGGGVGGGAQQS